MAGRISESQPAGDNFTLTHDRTDSITLSLIISIGGYSITCTSMFLMQIVVIAYFCCRLQSENIQQSGVCRPPLPLRQPRLRGCLRTNQDVYHQDELCQGKLAFSHRAPADICHRVPSYQVKLLVTHVTQTRSAVGMGSRVP